MQAGGGSELEASLLETPTFVLSVVFFVFLALSFSFELVCRRSRFAGRNAPPPAMSLLAAWHATAQSSV